jgi:cold shock protein
MASGTIIRFNQAKGYGFIEQDDGGEDVFLHSEELRDSGLIAPVGARVSFNILQGVRGLKACDIEVLKVAAHRGDTLRGEQPESLSTLDFGLVITDALIEVSPSITASQIVEIRQRLINHARQRGWLVDR